MVMIVEIVFGTMTQVFVKSFLHSYKIINISKRAPQECQPDPL